MVMMLQLFGWFVDHGDTVGGLVLAFVVGALVNELINNGWHGFFN